MPKTQRFTYDCIRYKVDMTKEAQEKLQEELNEKAEKGWEPFEFSCWSPYWVLVIYRKRK